MRQEYVNFNPETIRDEKLREVQVDLKYIDEQAEKQKKQYEYSESNTSSVSAWFEAMASGGLVGLVIGTCLCLGIGMMVETGTIPLTCFFGAPVIGTIIAYRKIFISYGKKKQLDGKLQEIENQHAVVSNNIADEVEKACREFNEGFEKEVVNKLSELSQTPIEQTTIKKFANEFIDIIQFQSREKKVKDITATYRIKCYEDKICTAGNEYSLMNILFKPLDGFAEKTAMARNVASAVWVELMTLMPTDPSGSSYTVDMKETYELDAAVVNMTYKADNMNYEEMKSW